jgi:tetratricopeptide (TPR) repeat protein
MSSDAVSSETNSQPSWRQRLRNDRNQAYWTRCTEEFVRQMRAKPPLDQRPELKNYAHWIDFTAEQRADIRPALLVRFTNEFARLAKVLGESGDVGVIAALDRAIELIQSIGKSTVRLQLAKAACYGCLMNEHADRRATLARAVDIAPEGGPVWAEAMLDLCQYYADVSQYDRARAAIAQFREKLPHGLLKTRYECAASVYDAYIKISSMHDLVGAEQDLERALTYEDMAEHDPAIAAWVSMAYYRKGRLDQMRQHYDQAIANYRVAHEVRGRWMRDPRTFAFINLRIAESYTAIGDLAVAKKYLEESSDLFKVASDRGTGWLQCSLARAAYEVADGRPDAGIKTLNMTRLQAKDIGFHRGELLCLGRLMVLHTQRRDLHSALRTVYAMIGTGELRRNDVIRLLRRFPTLIKAAR